MEHKAAAGLHGALHRRLRRPNPAPARTAEERVQAAGAERVEAQAALQPARQRAAALEPDALAAAQLPLRRRLERIDGAIADKVRDAVASPAPYLSSALGAVPL